MCRRTLSRYSSIPRGGRTAASVRRAARLGVGTALLLVGCADSAQHHAPPPRFSIIDVHTHLGDVRTWPGRAPNFEEIMRTMKRMNVELIVDFKAPDNSLANGVFGDRVTQRLAL